MLVFVYGTLTEPDRARAVLSAYEYRGPAVLEGLHRVEGEYPTLAPGGEVEGRLLATPEVDRLDEYEGVPDLYVRVSVPTVTEVAEEGSAEVYVGDPAKLDAPAEWPGTGTFEERARSWLDANEVLVRPRREPE